MNGLTVIGLLLLVFVVIIHNLEIRGLKAQLRKLEEK